MATQTRSEKERSWSHTCRLETRRGLAQNFEDVIVEARGVYCAPRAAPHSAAELCRRDLQNAVSSVTIATLFPDGEFELVLVHSVAHKSQAQNRPRPPSPLHVREHESAMFENWVWCHICAHSHGSVMFCSWVARVVKTPMNVSRWLTNYMAGNVPLR